MNQNYNQYYMFMGDYPKTMHHQRTKRLRGTNYTAREKKIFFQIIESRRMVIESKVLTSESLSRKAQVWEEVAREFNNYAEHKRSVKQLKILYDNLRRRARKNLLEGQTDPYFSKAQIFDTTSENDVTAIENKVSEVMVKTELDEAEQNGAESYSGESWALDEPSCVSVTLSDLPVVGNKVAVAEEIPSPRPNTDNVHKITPNNFQVPFNPEWGTHPAPPCLSGLPVSGGNKGGADDAPYPRRNTSYKKKLTINYKMKYFKQKFQNALLEHRHQKILFNLDVKIKKKQMELLSKQIESVL